MRNFKGFVKLLKLGANPNLDFDGNSVMHWVAGNPDVRYLDVALKHGGDPNLVANGKTPIVHTIGVGPGDNRSARLILLNAGADINARTKIREVFDMKLGGQTPILLVARLARVDIVYELLEFGADYEIKDVNGGNVLQTLAKLEGLPGGSSKLHSNLRRVKKWFVEKRILSTN